MPPRPERESVLDVVLRLAPPIVIAISVAAIADIADGFVGFLILLALTVLFAILWLPVLARLRRRT